MFFFLIIIKEDNFIQFYTNINNSFHFNRFYGLYHGNHALSEAACRRLFRRFRDNDCDVGNEGALNH